MLDLSNRTNIWLDHPRIVHAFYLVASEYEGEIDIRDELSEALDRIDAGDKFTGYESGDFLDLYRLRLRAYELAEDQTVNRQIRRELRQAATSGPYGFNGFGELIARAEASRKK